MKYLENVSDDVYFNLALEEYMLHHFKDDDYFLLWKNDSSIVVGKHQNVFEEINIKAVESMGLKVARRNTGGGTVFHDGGNLNYTFITDYDQDAYTDYDIFLNPVILALKSMGVPAAKSRTSDIVIEGKKISGSAQTIKRGRILHHGTLLFDADLDTLRELLKPMKGTMCSKAVKSVRSSVTNIKEHIDNKTMTMAEFQTLLLKALFPKGIERETLSPEQLFEINKLAEIKYSQWEWNYGNSPDFSYQKETIMLGEIVSVNFDVKNGMIISCEITCGKYKSKSLEEAIRGSRYSYTEILKRIEIIQREDDLKEVSAEALTDCFF